MEGQLTQLGMTGRQLSAHLESLGISADESNRGSKSDKIVRVRSLQRPSDQPGEANNADRLQAQVDELLRGTEDQPANPDPAAEAEPGGGEEAVGAEIRATQMRIRLLQLRREEAALRAGLEPEPAAASRTSANPSGEWQSVLRAALRPEEGGLVKCRKPHHSPPSHC